MKFQIWARFADMYENVENKHEETNDWQQAFGAFTIYAAHPECTDCEVSYYDEKGWKQIALSYTTPHM